MNYIEIHRLAEQFRAAIENSRDDGLFIGDDFDDFPNRCCGDTSDLLAEFFRSKRQENIYVCGEDETCQTHAWLVIKDKRINIPKPDYFDVPDNILATLNSYSNDAYNAPVGISHYTEDDVANGLIVDITADQFGECPIYVGYFCDFYRRFEFRMASEHTGLGNSRLRRIYEIILQHFA